MALGTEACNLFVRTCGIQSKSLDKISDIIFPEEKYEFSFVRALTRSLSQLSCSSADRHSRGFGGQYGKMECPMERRESPRKLLDPIHVAEMHAVERVLCLATYGTILNASAAGMLIRVKRQDLSPEFVQHQLSLEALEGSHVKMTIVEMALDIDATLIRTHTIEPECWDIAVDCTTHAPMYWRECLADLLPHLGESGQAHSS